MPSREDVAAEMIVRECASRGHRFPESEPLVPTETTTGPGGRIVNRRSTRCRECGTTEVGTWDQPENTPDGGMTAILIPITYEAPEPGDIPNLAERACNITDDELAAALAERFHGHAPPIPYQGELARPETLDIAVRVQARQFYLLDSKETLGSIIPVPGDAAGAGIIDSAPGAAVLWTALHRGTVSLTTVVSPGDPGPDLDGYDDVVEVTYRSTTGRVAVTELGGVAHPLPPLHAGYGDHRLRYHVRGADAASRADGSKEPVVHCLLQIWRASRTRPLILKTTSDWAAARARVTAPPPAPGVVAPNPPWRPQRGG
jgi:hypothetical protein